jgi:hypothetical protein
MSGEAGARPDGRSGPYFTFDPSLQRRDSRSLRSHSRACELPDAQSTARSGQRWPLWQEVTRQHFVPWSGLASGLPWLSKERK